MGAVTVLKERSEPAAGRYLGPATVIEAPPGAPSVGVRLPTGACVEARMALAVPYEPAQGDLLLVIGDDGDHYVIGVLRGSGRTVLELQGAVDVRAIGGPLTLSSDKAIRLDAPEIDVEANTLRTIAKTAIERFGTLKKRVADLFAVHAGQAQTVVDGTSTTQAKSTTLLSEEKVTINGRAIHLG